MMGLNPGITSTLTLTYVRYLSYVGEGGELNCSMPAPTMTLVGTLPTVTVPSNNSFWIDSWAEVSNWSSFSW